MFINFYKKFSSLSPKNSSPASKADYTKPIIEETNLKREQMKAVGKRSFEEKRELTELEAGLQETAALAAVAIRSGVKRVELRRRMAKIKTGKSRSRGISAPCVRGKNKNVKRYRSGT